MSQQMSHERQREKVLFVRFLLSERNLFRIVGGVSEGYVTTIYHLFRDVISERELNRYCNKITNICEEAVTSGTTNPQVVEELKVAGQTLFSLLFGPDVAQVLRSESPTSLLLEIDDALLFVPWELLHDGKGFLAEQFDLGRVVITQRPQQELTSRVCKRPLKILILADPDGGLPGAAKEGEELYKFLKQLGPDVEADLRRKPITEDMLRHILWNYDVVHYAGDANLNQGKQYAGSLQLYQRDKLTAKKVRDLAALKREAPLLVFANACRAGKTQRWFDQTKVYGLVHAFLLLGAHHFIGTLWAITDEDDTPIEFAKKTYEEIAKGKSVGEAIRLARVTLSQKYAAKSLTGASYVLYGDPTFTLFDEPLPLAFSLKELLDKGIRLEDQVHWGKALQRYFEFEKEMEKQENEPLLQDLFIRIGVLLARQGDFRRAQDYLEKIPTTVRHPEALNELALIHYKQGNFDQAQQMCEQSLSQLNTAPESFHKGQALHYLGLVKRAQRNLADASVLFEEARAIYDYVNYMEGLSQIYDSLGSLYFDLGNLDAALAYYLNSKHLKERLEDRYGLAITLGNIGRVYLVMGKWQQAKDYFERDLEIAQELPDERSIAMMCNYIGESLTALGNHEAAESSYQKAMDIYQKRDDLIGTAFSNRGMAETFLQSGNVAEAIIRAQEALDVFQQTAQVDPAGYAKWTLGKVYAKRGLLEQAEKMFQESIQNFQDIRLPIEEAEVEFDFGLMYLENGDPSKAATHLCIALDISHTQGMLWLANKFTHRLRNMEQNDLLESLYKSRAERGFWS